VEVGAEVADAPALGVGVGLYGGESDDLSLVLGGEVGGGGAAQPVLDPLALVGGHAPPEGLLGHLGEHLVEPVCVLGGEGGEVDGSPVL